MKLMGQNRHFALMFRPGLPKVIIKDISKRTMMVMMMISDGEHCIEGSSCCKTDISALMF